MAFRDKRIGMPNTTGNTKIPRDLFPDDSTVSAISLVDYLDWACCPDKYEKILALPPIQRGSVWKPKQIADLWDSVLRKMPVGSFMLSDLGKDTASIAITSNAERVMAKGKLGFNLLDGQQRTLALLLAWPGVHNPDKRIWIDLSQDGNNGSPFMLRITTQSQPFGYQEILHNKLSISNQRKARERFQNANPDLCQNDKLPPNYKLPLAKTRPWIEDGKEMWLLPLSELWGMLQKTNGDLENWLQAVRFVYFHDNNLEVTKLTKLRELGDALINLGKSTVALIFVPELAKPKDPTHDPMTVLFERIATGGTRLSPDDLLFSMIKQAHPEAHNLVQEIQFLKGDNGLPLVGHLMKQTDLVMTAVRLACADPRAPERIKKLPDNPSPNTKDFYKYLDGGDFLGTDNSPGPLLQLIQKVGTKDAPIVTAFRQLTTFLQHREGNDMGLPRVLLPYLSRGLLQVLLFWLVSNPKAKLEDSRRDILQFVLFWKLCERDWESSRKASKIAFEYLKNNQSANFPAKTLYGELCKKIEQEQSYFLALVPPKELKNALNLTPNSTLRTMEERFYSPNECSPIIESYTHFWRDKASLLWIQRDMLTRRYGDYDALADKVDKDNVPYDFDHLCPQAHWSDGRSITMPKAFDSAWKRHLLGNAIGNYRLIDASENRSDSDESFSKKIDLNTENTKWKDSAFFPNNEELNWWRIASPEGDKALYRTWNAARVESFQAAVEHRTFSLYQRYFDEAGFEEWFNE